MFLLDTNVVSELRKAQIVDANVVAWAESQSPSSLFLSVISVLEIETGILLLERRDTTQAAVLRTWLDGHVLRAFSDRILPVDTAVAKRCAGLHVPDPCSDRDALIAATALVHGMILATRNVNDFRTTGVKVLDPWQHQTK